MNSEIISANTRMKKLRGVDEIFYWVFEVLQQEEGNKRILFLRWRYSLQKCDGRCMEIQDLKMRLSPWHYSKLFQVKNKSTEQNSIIQASQWKANPCSYSLLHYLNSHRKVGSVSISMGMVGKNLKSQDW